MQIFIDFLVSNYLWFLVISLILVFALIGYLVDTSERVKKTDLEEQMVVEEENNGVDEIPVETVSISGLNMGMEDSLLEKDVIEVPNEEDVSINMETVETKMPNNLENPEVLDIE